MPGYIQNRAGRLHARCQYRLRITPNIISQLNDWTNSASIDCRYRANITRRCRDALVQLTAAFYLRRLRANIQAKAVTDETTRWQARHQTQAR